MRVLMVGAGGVGDAAARIAAERPFFESWVVADYDVTRADFARAVQDENLELTDFELEMVSGGALARDDVLTWLAASRLF